jgi:hypothetical protein
MDSRAEDFAIGVFVAGDRFQEALWQLLFLKNGKRCRFVVDKGRGYIGCYKDGRGKERRLISEETT